MDNPYPRVSEADWPPDLVLVDCARCGRTMRGLSNRVLGFYHLPRVAGRVFGRPYCGPCYDHAVSEPAPPVNKFVVPSQE